MTDNRLIASIIVVVIAAVSAGGYFAVRLASAPAEQIASQQSTVTAAFVSQTPQANPENREIATDTINEVRQLRDENRHLRKQLDAALASVQSLQTTTSTRQDVIAGAPTIDQFNVFAKKFIGALTEHEKTYWKKATAKDGNTYTVFVRVLTTDLKRTDSVVNPIVGQLVFREDRFMSNKYVGRSGQNADTFTLSMACHQGAWTLVSGEDKVDVDNFYPKTTDSTDRTGQVISLDSWHFSDEVVAANRH